MLLTTVSSSLQKYLKAFTHLKRGVTKYGLAPHKPVLLLSLIELIEKGLVTNNQFEVNADFTQPFIICKAKRWEENPIGIYRLNQAIKF